MKAPERPRPLRCSTDRANGAERLRPFHRKQTRSSHGLRPRGRLEQTGGKADSRRQAEADPWETGATEQGIEGAPRVHRFHDRRLILFVFNSQVSTTEPSTERGGDGHLPTSPMRCADESRHPLQGQEDCLEAAVSFARWTVDRPEDRSGNRAHSRGAGTSPGTRASGWRRLNKVEGNNTPSWGLRNR